MPAFARLPIAAGTHYAELVEQLRMSADRSVSGSFVAKQIKGRRYWYLQEHSPGTGQRQTYVGADTPEVRQRIEVAHKRREELRDVASDRARIGAMATAGGAYVHAPAEVRVLRLLADRGVFRVGTVLVGSLAFGVFGNMLGVRWPAGSTRTRDVDLAHDPRITLAVARDTAPMLAKRQGEAPDTTLQLSPIPPLHHKHPSTSFRVLGTELHVDLLTPLIGRDRSSPIHIPALGAAATPLRFLDYLIEETQPAAIVGGDGVLVNVPGPARFALHKLLVAEQRSVAHATKARKDFAQAEALVEVLAADRPGDLALAWEALEKRGMGWMKRITGALRRMEPGAAAALERAVGQRSGPVRGQLPRRPGHPSR